MVCILLLTRILDCRKRAALEGDDRQKQQEREKQAKNLASFTHTGRILATKEDPDNVCVCCNWRMYRKTVIEFKATKYSKAPIALKLNTVNVPTNLTPVCTLLPRLPYASQIASPDVSYEAKEKATGDITCFSMYTGLGEAQK